MKKLTFTIFTFLFSMALLAQPNIEWQKCLGGTSADYAYSIQQTTDGGYIVAGSSSSTDGDISNNHGVDDAWVVKLDDSGAIEWEKSLGGTGYERIWAIQQTTDGGYILAGHTNSTNGDVSGNHGDIDIWVVKLKSTGAIDWQKCLGGTDEEYAFSIQQTTDGGYIIVGYTDSDDGDVSGDPEDDIWIVKLKSTGDIEWQKCLGGDGYDMAYSIQQTTDGGYIIAGSTDSNDGDVSGNHGSSDFWVVKLKPTGDIEWQKCFGGTNYEVAYSIQQTTDEGYIVVGSSSSNDGDVSNNYGETDFWVVKLDDSGTIEWQKNLGGTDDDEAYSVQQTKDGGYILAGHTNSTNGDVSGNHGDIDIWVVKLKSTGAIDWQKCLGGTDEEYAFSIQQTIDEGYIVAGTSSSNDVDVSGNHGDYDFWVVKLSKYNTDIQTISNNKSAISIYPNPVNNTTTVNISATKSVEAQMTIISVTGQVVFTQNFSLNAGQNVVNINISSLEKGTYILRLTQNQQITVKRFIK